MNVRFSRFNESIFELLHPDGKQRAFVRRQDPEYLEVLQAEAENEARRKKVPFGLGRLLPTPTIEITDERWHKLRARISGSFPAVKL